jgi:hypothetical protein
MGTPSSITRTGKNEDFQLQVSREQIPFHQALYKFGYNPDINGIEETIWTQGGIYSYPTTAAQLYVSSSSGDDANGGTGANSIKIVGLDADYNEVEEDITLTGQTQKITQTSWLRVYRMYITLAGSGGGAAGTIYLANTGASAGVPTGTIYASIPLGAGQTEMAVYTVPAGYTLYLDDINFTSAVSLANSYIQVRFLQRDFGTNVFREQTRIVLQSNTYIFKFEYPLRIPEKTDLEVRAISDGSNNNPLSATWQGILIKNEIPA